MSLTSRPLVFAVTLVVLLVSVRRFQDHTVDDAYIAYRYAENWAGGEGPVFNPGERVEGYTGFLWVVLLAGADLFGLPPTQSSDVLGVLSALLVLGLLARAGPRPNEAPVIVWIAPLLFATSPVFGVWTTGGLEVPLYSALVLAAVVLAMRDVEVGRLSAATAACSAAAALSRPEGLGLALVIALSFLLLRRDSLARRSTLRFLALVALVVGPHLVWRWSYYGYPLPNTYYAKVGGGSEELVRGLAYLKRFFVTNGYLLLLPLPGLLWATRRGPAAVLFATALALLAGVVWVGGDSLPMHRFVAPALPLLFLAAGHGLEGALQRWNPGARGRWTAGALLGLLAVLAARPAYAGRELAVVDQDRREVAAWSEIGRFFAKKARTGDTIAVVTAGAIPYFSGMVAIDMLGLNDATIAHRDVTGMGSGPAGHEKHDAQYVLDRRPTFVVVGVYGLTHAKVATRELVQPFYAAERELLEARRFQEEYELRRGRTEAGDFAYHVRRE